MNKNIIKCLIIISLISSGQLFNCERERPTKQGDIIATIGARKIDRKHLQRSFELSPKWGKGLTYKQAYQNQLDFLIDEKLFAQAALNKGLQNDPQISAHIDFIQKKEMIKELYRQQVSSKIQISESEYKAAYLKMKKKVQFNYFFSPSPDHVEMYRKSLDTYSFDEVILLDPENDFKGTSPMFSFGDMQQELEEVVFDLAEGEISIPIEVADGYMVVQLIDGSIDKFASERDYAEMKSKIEKIIFERKVRKAANIYVKELMLDKELTLNPPVFYVLSDQLSNIIQDKMSETPVPIFVDDQEINTARKSVSEIIDEVLITYRDGEMTVRDFLDELMKMPADLRPNVKMAIQLKNAIGIIIRNEYLAKQAIEMGLSNHPNVIYETTIQTDEILSKLWLRQIYNQQQKLQNESTLFHELLNNKLKSEEALSRLHFEELRKYASDSLQKIYPVTLDTTLYYSVMKHPEDTIRFDPVKIVVRELFN
jgi:hypothetical protein